MPGPDILDSQPPPPPRRHWEEGHLRFIRRLSERTPLRTKLIAAVLALVVMAMAVVSVVSVLVLRTNLYTQRDSQIENQFNDLAYRVANSSGYTIPLNVPYSQGTGIIAAFQQIGSQLSAGNTGTTLPGLGNSPPKQSLPRLPAGQWASSGRPVLITVPAQSGSDTWRVIGEAIPVTNGTTQVQETAVLLVAVDLGPVGVEIQRLIALELIVGAATVIVLAVVGVGVVRANLRPLDDIEMTAGEIAKGHLDHRIPERDPRTEVGSLGRSLNVMLSQIEAAFHAREESEQAAHESEERMRRFIADASHELRTPLTTIRGFAAHYRQRGGARGWMPGLVGSGAPGRGPAGRGLPDGGGFGGGEVQDQSSRTDPWSPAPANGASGSAASGERLSPEELDRLMARVESEATRMGLLVEDLLTLARLDQQRPLNIAPVDLLTLAADAVQDARIVDPDRPVSLSVQPGTAFLVDGDEARLRQVLANLVNNALTHTPTGTPVRVKIGSGTLVTPPGGTGGAGEESGAGGVTGAGGTSGAGEDAGRGDGERQPVPAVVLDVQDDGPGMTAEQAQRVFERFYRADAARNRASGGTGLGLAIVAGLVAAHGGTVSVRTAPGEGADFQVRLPLSPDAQLDDSDDD